MVDDPNPPERPRSEPEIIPPDRTRREPPSGSGWTGGWPPYGYARTRSTERIFVTRVGPVGLALVLLVIAFIAAVVLLTLLGAVLIWLPVIAVLAIVAAVAGLFRRR